jgi:lysine-specific demethylase 8
VPELISRDEDEIVASLQQYFDQQQPLVLRRYASGFPAVRRWKSFEYLEQAVDPDVPCDVEIGAYNQGQRLTIAFGDYMQYLRAWRDTHGAAENGSTAPPDQLLYLAQNDLSMFGGLSKDITIPSYCVDGRLGHGRLYNVMLWLGPRGCLSPLHYDPLDNLLIQVVGRKRVALLSKDADAACVYAGESHDQQTNTSAVDVESPDLERFPRFESVRKHLQSTVLEPGDVLYVPSKWWHHVRSLDWSVSVNVWWR